MTRLSNPRVPGQPAYQAAPEAMPRRKLVFFIVSLALLMSSVDATVVATALSTVQTELHASLAWSGWTITIYSLGQILVMPLAGKISDMYGRRRVFLVAAALFTIASLFCGLATSIPMLVVLRAVQAIGGGAFMPSASGIVADHFGPNRDRALGMFTSIFPIGGVIGPILGGLFVTYWSWRGIFLVNVPIGILLIVLAVVFIPESRRLPGRRLDFYGVALLGILILSAMFGITLLGQGTTSLLSPAFFVPELIAALALALFLRHARRGRAPFIPAALLHGRGFGIMNLINFLFGAAALGFGALVPLYAEDRFGISVLQAGTLLTARAIGMICVAGLAVLALRRTGYRLPMVVGFSTVAVGLAGLSWDPALLAPYAWLSIAAGIAGIGMGMATPASNNAIMQLAPDQIGGIAGLRGMFRQGGSIMSISVVTALVSRSDDPGSTLAIAFIVFACIIVASLPLIFLVPEHKAAGSAVAR